jgi:hypothetical protein
MVKEYYIRARARARAEEGRKEGMYVCYGESDSE